MGVTSDDKDLWMPSSTVLMTMQGVEICVKSIPQSVIQMSLVLGMASEDNTPIQLVSLFSSFAACAFIQTEGNFGQGGKP